MSVLRDRALWDTPITQCGCNIIICTQHWPPPTPRPWLCFCHSYSLLRIFSPILPSLSICLRGPSELYHTLSGILGWYLISQISVWAFQLIHNSPAGEWANNSIAFCAGDRQQWDDMAWIENQDTFWCRVNSVVQKNRTQKITRVTMWPLTI